MWQWHVSTSVTLALSSQSASRSLGVTHSANDLNSGHNDEPDETSVIRLHAAERDGEAGSRCYRMFCFSLFFVLLTSLQEGNENPFTRLPHSAQYAKILEARKKLPVFAQMAEFYEMVSPALSFVCEGAIESAPQVAPGIKAMCR